MWTLPHILLLIDVVMRKMSTQEKGFLDSYIRPAWPAVLKSTSVLDKYVNANYIVKDDKGEDKKELCFNSKNEDVKKPIWDHNCTCKQNM